MWLWILISLEIITKLHGYSNGRFPESCVSMLPEHRDRSGILHKPQRTDPPFEITYDPAPHGKPITVYLKSKQSNKFTGFMLEARMTGTEDVGPAVGKFIVLDSRETELLSCHSSPDNAVSQRRSSEKRLFAVNWTSPQGEQLDYTFRATFHECQVNRTITNNNFYAIYYNANYNNSNYYKYYNANYNNSNYYRYYNANYYKYYNANYNNSNYYRYYNTNYYKYYNANYYKYYNANYNNSNYYRYYNANYYKYYNTNYYKYYNTNYNNSNYYKYYNANYYNYYKYYNANYYKYYNANYYNYYKYYNANYYKYYNTNYNNSNYYKYYNANYYNYYKYYNANYYKYYNANYYNYYKYYNANYYKNRVLFIALVCVAIAFNFMELFIVCLRIEPSHELKEISELTIKVCSVIHWSFTTAIIFLGVLEFDNCGKDFWLVKVMIAYTVWILLFVIWVYVSSIHRKTILGGSKIGK
ncbi:Ferric-chelate reductase 1 [Dissostichus eleginoides]|uniref:Ferric-chelate reductase 1 n=1 Tax=Dissostichus eleginoides TaxID=100907 RepID=A0AAD9C965_DISEL|nr:Ferric-chelate reductase 1 [Dissostichus eleginoides]